MESLGVRFVPNHQELVEYLRHHDGGHTLNSFGAINEASDPYSSHPEQLSNISVKGSYYYADREAEGRRTLDDSGFWKSSDKQTPVHKDGRVAGYKRNLRFYLGHYSKSKSTKKSTKWVMTEYTLPHGTSPGAGKAICVIRMTAEKQGNEIGQASTSEATNHHNILMTLAEYLGVDYE